MLRRLFVLLGGGMFAFIVLGSVVFGAGVVSGVGNKVHLDRLHDLGYLVDVAEIGGTATDHSLLATTVERYAQVYGYDTYVVDRNGTVTFHAGPGEPHLTDEAEAAARRALKGHTTEYTGGPIPWNSAPLILAEPIVRSADVAGAIVTVSDTVTARGEIVHQWMMMGAVALATIVAVLAVVHGLARWVLRPVHRLSRAVHDLQAGAWDTRIDDLDGPPELRQLAGAFNTMVAEIETAFDREAAFVANASHQLRNPVSALLLRVESLSLSIPSVPDSATAALRAEIDELRREGWHIAALLEDVLRLARADHHAEHAAVADVGAAVRTRLEIWRPRASAKGIHLVDDGIGHYQGWYNTTGLEGALDAVLDNAIKYSPPHSDVDIRVAARGDEVMIEIRDHGPGLDADELEHVTERFWRSESHHDVDGTGLGLAIARVCVESFGGRLQVLLPDEGGLAVRVMVPSEMSQHPDRPAPESAVVTEQVG